MKRQSGNLQNQTKVASLTKRIKKGSKVAMVKPKEVAAKVVEEPKEALGSEVAAAAAMEMMDSDSWGSWWTAGDEQMSWATCWIPFWDEELTGDMAFNEWYDDVLWDDDIWDLKQSKVNVGNP